MPSPPPKSGTVIIPVCSLRISFSLIELELFISFFEIICARSGKEDTCLIVLVDVIITSSKFSAFVESFVTSLVSWEKELLIKKVKNKCQ